MFLRERGREREREGERERERVGRGIVESAQTVQFTGLTSLGMNGGSISLASSSSQVQSQTLLRKELVRVPSRFAALAGKRRGQWLLRANAATDGAPTCGIGQTPEEVTGTSAY